MQVDARRAPLTAMLGLTMAAARAHTLGVLDGVSVNTNFICWSFCYASPRQKQRL